MGAKHLQVVTVFKHPSLSIGAEPLLKAQVLANEQSYLHVHPETNACLLPVKSKMLEFWGNEKGHQKQMQQSAVIVGKW